MAIKTIDLLTIERWSGRVRPDRRQEVEDLIETLGAPEVVALQLLMTLQANDERTPADMTAARNRVNRTQNMIQRQKKIDRLIGAILATPNLSLNSAAQKILDQAQGGDVDATRAISLGIRNPRRGG